MLINKIVTQNDTRDLTEALRAAIADSRFTAKLEHTEKTVKIAMVRLKERKYYCGNHPKACEVRTDAHKHRKLKLLEGVDWVEFNDLVNDILDALDVSCNVKTSTCTVRKGRRRRVIYESNTRDTHAWVWDKDGPDYHYADNCGNPLPSRHLSMFPEGTPGIDSRRDYLCDGSHAYHHDHH